MKTAHDLGERSAAWVSHTDRLLEAYGDWSDAAPRLRRKLENLRHKRETVVTKQVALAHHALMGREQALEQLEAATSELGDAWRAVVADISRGPLRHDPDEKAKQ